MVTDHSVLGQLIEDASSVEPEVSLRWDELTNKDQDTEA